MSPRVKRALQWALAAFMTTAGVAHFVNPGFFVALVPPALPAPELLVYASGVAEIAFGVGLMIPRLTRYAAWGIIATLIAVFPANIYHAWAGGLTDPNLPPIMGSGAVAIARLPFQLVFIAWAWMYARE